MFCVNCGTQRRPEARFCTKCGTGSTEYQPQHKEYYGRGEARPTPEHPQDVQALNNDELMYAHPVTPIPEPKKKSRVGAIAAACVLVVLLAVGSVVGFTIFNNPSLAVSRAVSNSTSEISERLATTPIQAFELLMGTLENGTVNVAFDYTDIWNSWWTDETIIETHSGHFSLASNASTNNMALRGNIHVYDSPNVSFAAYINPERVAFGSPNLSNNYYGFMFDSFRQDFIPFGRDVLGMWDDEMDMVSNIVEEIGSWLERSNATMEELEPYIDVFTRFLRDAESGSERGQEVRVGFETITARRVDYVITMQALTQLLHTWINILENDDTIRAAFDNPMYNNMFGRDAFNEMIRELRWGVREMEDYLRGHITLSFYIGSRSRLVQVALSGALTVDGDSASFRVALNFGNNATDRWVLSGNASDSWGTTAFSAYWDIDSTGGRHVNTFHIEADRDESFTLISDWNPTTGDFVFSYEEVTRWGVWGEEFLRGNYTTNGQTFRLEFNHENDWSGSTLDLVIYTDNNTDTGTDVSFINIDRWGDELLDRLDDLFWELGW
ncbi:MAG: zinc-ribbon domain-containing protein [Defluviitaleaceae bacterium]|nr:zinc-ribbon domain-containing protein [Defluviitaleaceae bacterium]